MNRISFLIVVLFGFWIFVRSSYATYDPVIRPNNKFGIHILFTWELERASKLVNSQGGDWGYITIPIQYGDRNLEKWQKFMYDCQTYHLIPILRLATEGYWKNTSVWRKPTENDILDFANFLNSLSWPTQNRYVLLFNESNRFDEWGGMPPSPEDYADFVSYAIDVFKGRSPDFFIIAGGLDNASPNDGVKYLDNFIFLKRMGNYNPDLFKKVDGFASHSYPNPNFTEPPSTIKLEGTSTYKYELSIVEGYAGESKPVFITETGWNAQVLPESVISSYFKTAMNEIWGQDPNIIAITPFILESNGGPFDKFTFYKGNSLTSYGLAYQSLAKQKGDPVKNLVVHTVQDAPTVNPTTETFGKGSLGIPLNFTSKILKSYFKTVFAIGK